ncbi:hypothetical protein Syun_030045 [Stephania yunnanensis]|uniref:SNRNP25 ubiquitin-like domain-containing protein n=1 Tax=Stephania yunnanensis TaxID=152371 RepID=A0AAP0E6R4_9MAGN
MGLVGALRKMHHSSSGYKKFHQTPLCYLSIVDPHGGFGFGFLGVLDMDVQTLETATVADLKKVVEHAFVERLKEEERVLISWSHVWSHFCLCFQGHKLINNEDHILLFGIRDGCKLHFVQHRSTNSGLTVEFRERRISTRNQPKITLEKSDLQLYEGGVSAVNKSGAVNPQLMKPKFH